MAGHNVATATMYIILLLKKVWLIDNNYNV